MFKLSFIYIGSFCFILSLLSFFNIIYSYYFEILYNIEIYIYTLIISLIFASLFFVKKNELKKISIYEKIISVAAGYLILPLIVSVPYYFGLSNLSFLNIILIYSGFTSKVLRFLKMLKTRSEYFNMSLSQWFGGYIF